MKIIKMKFLVAIFSSFLLLCMMQTTHANPINLNTADAKMLSHSIKGIGIKRAESIVKYRESHGAFKAVTDLSSVPLIGKNFVSKHLKEMEERFTVK